jgi:hypothetical protein
VRGAWFEMHPKRLSHMACGFARSTRNHQFLMLSFKPSAGRGPIGISEAGKESGTEKFTFDCGQISKEGVRAKTGSVAESQPPPPCPVMLFIAAFLSAVKDDAAIGSADKTHDKILAGSCKISKLSGICSGQHK